MFKVKNIVVASICGFVLSFLISVISTHRFGVSLLRGLIFCIVFAILAFAIDYLNSRFLNVEGGVNTDVLDENSKRTSAESNSKAGSIVNITIDDENLTEDEQAPSFDVASTRQVFAYKTEPKEKEEIPDVKTSSMVTESVPINPVETLSNAEPNNSSEFTPVQLGQPIENNETIINETSNIQENEKQKNDKGFKEIEALPDIGEFASSVSDDSGDDGTVSSIISDSEFAQSGDLTASAAMTEGGDMMKQDSKIIASAIRTLLKKED